MCIENVQYDSPQIADLRRAFYGLSGFEEQNIEGKTMGEVAAEQ